MVCALLSGYVSTADTGDWYVITLKDGTTVEGKSISENSVKVVVEFQERGITKQKTVYRNNAATVKILTPAEAEQRRAAMAARPAVTAPASPIPGPATSPTVATTPASAEQWVQQGRQLLAQGRFAEAIQAFEQATGKPDGANAIKEPQELLKQTYAAWLQSLQRSRAQATNQLEVVKQRVASLQKEIQTTENALQWRRMDVRSSRARIYSSPGSSGTSGSFGTYGSPTVLPGGDPADQGVINSLELRMMTEKQELDKRTAEMHRLEQQVAMLDQQIVVVQSHIKIAWHETILAWIRANPFWTIGALLLLWLVLKRVPSSS